jgi:hypothetical protein
MGARPSRSDRIIKMTIPEAPSRCAIRLRLHCVRSDREHQEG